MFSMDLEWLFSPDANNANACIPAGRYLTACGTGSFEDTEPVYRALLDYAGAHGIDIIGNPARIDAQVKLQRTARDIAHRKLYVL